MTDGNATGRKVGCSALLGRCCYGGLKRKAECGSCSAWHALEDIAESAVCSAYWKAEKLAADAEIKRLRELLSEAYGYTTAADDLLPERIRAALQPNAPLQPRVLRSEAEKNTSAASDGWA